jgi:hypothetical protein
MHLKKQKVVKRFVKSLILTCIKANEKYTIESTFFM